MGFNLEDPRAVSKGLQEDLEALEDQLFVTFTSEPVKEGCYIHGKVKVWKDKIRTNFHGKDIRYNQCCKTTAVLKVGLVYKQGSNYYPQVYVEEAKIKPVENSKCRLLSNSEDNYEWIVTPKVEEEAVSS